MTSAAPGASARYLRQAAAGSSTLLLLPPLLPHSSTSRDTTAPDDRHRQRRAWGTEGREQHGMEEEVKEDVVKRTTCNTCKLSVCCDSSSPLQGVQSPPALPPRPPFLICTVPLDPLPSVPPCPTCASLLLLCGLLLLPPPHPPWLGHPAAAAGSSNPFPHGPLSPPPITHPPAAALLPHTHWAPAVLPAHTQQRQPADDHPPSQDPLLLTAETEWVAGRETDEAPEQRQQWQQWRRRQQQWWRRQQQWQAHVIISSTARGMQAAAEHPSERGTLGTKWSCCLRRPCAGAEPTLTPRCYPNSDTHPPLFFTTSAAPPPPSPLHPWPSPALPEAEYPCPSSPLPPHLHRACCQCRHDLQCWHPAAVMRPMQQAHTTSNNLRGSRGGVTGGRGRASCTASVVMIVVVTPASANQRS